MFLFLFSFHLIIGGPISDGIRLLLFSTDLLDGKTSIFFSVPIDFGRHKTLFFSID